MQKNVCQAKEAAFKETIVGSAAVDDKMLIIEEEEKQESGFMG